MQHDDPFGDHAADDPRRELILFFRELEHLMGWAVKYRHHLIAREMTEYLDRAWREVEPSFAAIQRDLEEVPEEVLRERGLTGPQLTLKLQAFQRQRSQFAKYERTVEQGRWFERVLNGIARVLRLGRKATTTPVSPA